MNKRQIREEVRKELNKILKEATILLTEIEKLDKKTVEKIQDYVINKIGAGQYYTDSKNLSKVIYNDYAGLVINVMPGTKRDVIRGLKNMIVDLGLEDIYNPKKVRRDKRREREFYDETGAYPNVYVIEYKYK